MVLKCAWYVPRLFRLVASFYTGARRGSQIAPPPRPAAGAP